MSVERQPISAVEWLPRESLMSNDYNPNYVAPPELDLLETSIMEDGWTQPIVVWPDSNRIIDGFHRYLVSGRESVYAMTNGLVPVVRVSPKQGSHIASTIRHNRARGKHSVMQMSFLVQSLHNEYGASKEEIARQMGMEEEEVTRLLNASTVVKAVQEQGREWSKGWKPQ